MKFHPTVLAEVMVLTPEICPDQRGYFRECFRYTEFERHCDHHRFVQDIVSHSLGSTLHGLHYQPTHPQGKLVQALNGAFLMWQWMFAHPRQPMVIG